MITKQQSDFLKLIALCAMVLDHIGFYLLPELVELRAIGRIAFPIFAYQLTIGYSMTSSKKDYFYRLIIVGLVSQIPHYFLSNELYLNILFTLALGVLALYSIDKKKYYYLFLIIPLSFLCSYSVYGILIILIFYIFKGATQFGLFSFSTILYSLYVLWPIQAFALFAFPIITNPVFKITLPKNFFYIFYPAHLLVILLIKKLTIG